MPAVPGRAAVVTEFAADGAVLSLEIVEVVEGRQDRKLHIVLGPHDAEAGVPDEKPGKSAAGGQPGQNLPFGRIVFESVGALLHFSLCNLESGVVKLFFQFLAEFAVHDFFRVSHVIGKNCH